MLQFQRVSIKPLGSLEKEGKGEIDERKESEELSEIKKTIKNHKVVTALIATVTFAAGFTPPGCFVYSEGDQQGLAVLSIPSSPEDTSERAIAKAARKTS